MGKKLRRPEKGSIHRLPLYSGVEVHTTPPEVAALFKRYEAEVPLEETELSVDDMDEMIADLREHLKSAIGPKPIGVSNNEELEDVVVGLTYRGPKVSARWMQRQTGIQLEESRRLGKARTGFGRDTIPELYRANALSPEGLGETQELLIDVFRDAVRFVDGVEGLEQADFERTEGKERETFIEEVAEFLTELGFDEQIRLMVKAIELQSLRRSQTFPVAGSRVVGAGATDDA